MSLRLYSFFRGIQKTNSRKFSTVVKVQNEQVNQVCSFRTSENNPVNHNADHFARFYTIPADIYKRLFHYGGMPLPFKKHVVSFQECSIMIRQPAIEIISYLNRTDYTRPANKYVLYGKVGAGKSLTLNHIIHYAFLQKFVIVHVYWAKNWFKVIREVTNSVLSPGCVDLPIDAGFWLKHFRNQNSNLLAELDLKVSKDYVWNQREKTLQGTSILELIKFGTSRIKYACGVVDALLSELKLAGTTGKCKTLVVIDGFNAMTSNHTLVKDENKMMVLPDKISLVRPFLDITKGEWSNGTIVLTVDQRADRNKYESYFPRFLLGKKGFEHLDPFLPVFVDEYNVTEFDSMIEYYKDRKWIRNITPNSQRELELITNKNPYILMDKCKFL